MTWVAPSILSADFAKLKEEIQDVERNGADWIHIDVMDGHFVPNITLGPAIVSAIRPYTKLPFDVHLMIENPSEKVDWFIDAGADLIYIHPESERYVIKTLAHIQERGKLAGIAMNPDTSIEAVKEMLYLCDYVMIMTVNPGFAGQKFIDFTTEKIKKIVSLKEKYRFKVMIDGACSPAVIKNLRELGCDGFILGTSALFNKQETYKELIENLRK